MCATLVGMTEPAKLQRPPLPTRHDIIHSDPEIMSGVWVFRGTRVPVDTLFHYLSAGDDLDEFLDSFPSVTRDQAVTLLEAIGRELVRRD